MSNKKANILIVDDEAYNVKILERLLKKADYNYVSAEDGQIAWDYLQKNHKYIDLILLDRMMPNMNGMQVMEKINADKKIKEIPVIMQTAAGAKEEVIEGINAGVFYYLTKPYEEEVLLSLVESALRHANQDTALKKEVQSHKKIFGIMTMAQFKIKSLREAYNLSYFIANFFPDPKRVVSGIYGLITNAIEHGHVGIKAEEKKELLKEKNAWFKEVTKRQQSPENIDKIVDVRYGYDENEKEYRVYVKDQGKGFDWLPYSQVNYKRVLGGQGRGITRMMMYNFDSLEFLGDGNEVLAIVKEKSKR